MIIVSWEIWPKKGSVYFDRTMTLTDYKSLFIYTQLYLQALIQVPSVTIQWNLVESSGMDAFLQESVGHQKVQVTWARTRLPQVGLKHLNAWRIWISAAELSLTQQFHVSDTHASIDLNYQSFSVVVINFFNHTDPTKPAEEIWLEDSFTATSSKGQMTALLSMLLPGIIQNASPIEGVIFFAFYSFYTKGTCISEHGGHLYRPGWAADSSHIDIGAVNTFACGEMPWQLAVTHVDEYVLRSLDSGEYTSDIFWEQPLVHPFLSLV